MEFAQRYTPGIAQYSYVVGSGRKCVVVDPMRDIEPYLRQAEAFGMEIVAVLETHLHADFISGHMELAKKTGATIYAPKIANCAFPHVALDDGEMVTIGSLQFQLLETPGHTPESAVYVVTDLSRGEEPTLVFTGDTLMVGDVGRPDLFPKREQELTEKLFTSLNRLKGLPDYVEVYPAHGKGSLCAKALSDKRWSTIGIERRHNYAFQISDLATFKKVLLTDMPAAPDHFARCSEINRIGPKLVRDLPLLAPLDPAALQDEVARGKKVLDTRSYLAFAAAHIPGSYSISKYGNFATFAGWILPPEEDLLVILENKGDLPNVMNMLQSVGVDNVVGYLDGSMEQWINSGYAIAAIETMSVSSLHEQLASTPPLVLDTRAKSEWGNGHIAGSKLAPTPDIRHLYTKWDTSAPVAVLCNTSNRSMTAASILKQKGFARVINVMGGSTAWQAAGYPLIT